MRNDRIVHSDRTPGAESPAAAGAARARYLLQQLDLSHDPFLHSVAEQEIDHQPDQFYVYSAEINADLLRQLVEAEHSIVFAPPGAGKTTLRYNLAYQLRRDEPTVLPVTYQLTDITAFDVLQAETNLLRETAKDLLISLFRQKNIARPPHITPGSPGARLLASLLHQPTYRRTLERLLSLPDNRPISTLWKALGRAGTPHTAWTSLSLRQFASSLLALPFEPQQAVSIADLPAILAEFGFSHLYLLVDSIDAVERTPEQMVQMVQLPINWASLHTSWLILKLFLPSEIEPILFPLMESLQSQASVQRFHLRWTDEQLEQVLLQRLNAAHSGFASVQDLFDRRDANMICSELAQAAQGSPRAMFRLLSAVIDAHIARNTPSLALTYDDWRTGRRITSLS